MPKVIIDFLSSRKDTILNDPISFIITLVIGAALGYWIQKERIENNEERLKTNEERLKLAEDKIKEKDDQIQKYGQCQDRLTLSGGKC